MHISCADCSCSRTIRSTPSVSEKDALQIIKDRKTTSWKIEFKYSSAFLAVPLGSLSYGDFFGPEPEFFVFDDVRIKNDMNECGFKIDSKEVNQNLLYTYIELKTHAGVA